MIPSVDKCRDLEALVGRGDSGENFCQCIIITWVPKGNQDDESFQSASLSSLDLDQVGSSFCEIGCLVI